MRMKARLLDDRPDASQRLDTLCGQLAAEQPHPARGRLGQPEQEPDQCGLARAVGAEKAEGRAARDFEVDTLERRPGPEPLAKTVGVDGE